MENNQRMNCGRFFRLFLCLFLFLSINRVQVVAAVKYSICADSTQEKPDSIKSLLPPVVPDKPDHRFDLDGPLGPLVPFDPTPVPGVYEYNNGYSVGAPITELSVNNLGAAVYNLEIETPNSGELTPHIGLSYNSQFSGYGLAGYGFNITGISVITRGGRDMFHDEQLKGLSYTMSDNFFLDGKRLILQSSNPDETEVLYTLEGDPFTKVIAHRVYVNYSSGTCAPDTWFEVRTNNGMVYKYGRSKDSSICYKNKAGATHIYSWYIDEAKDKYDNYIYYSYYMNSLCALPEIITYGNNHTHDRGVKNAISFKYEHLGNNNKKFIIEDQKAELIVRLQSITTSSNDSIYRKYNLKYNEKIDQGARKYTRLVEIEEANGKGEKYLPIKFKWSPLPSHYISFDSIKVETKDKSSLVLEKDKTFFAVDLTGDGISDIIRISDVDHKIGPRNITESETHVYINKSKVDVSGKITYEEPLLYHFPPRFIKANNMQNIFGENLVLDYDGDGYNDLVLTRKLPSAEEFYIISGRMVKNNITEKDSVKVFFVSLVVGEKSPLITNLDTDGDGISDIVYVEPTQKDGYYHGGIIRKSEDPKPHLVKLNFNLSKEPQRLFIADFNNDGLSDLFFLYDVGYTIYYNNGFVKNALVFSESNKKNGDDFSEVWRIQQGDFDGDGLIDFVYSCKESPYLWIAHNNGDGTFSHEHTIDLDASNHDSCKDDDKYSLLVWDIDHDGRSDVTICKARYKHINLEFRNAYIETSMRWLFSTDTNLALFNSRINHRVEDALQGTIFLGDFDGDGYPELANYGGLLGYEKGKIEDNINVYKTWEDEFAQSGKITYISEGMKPSSKIEYSYMTDPRVYKQTDNKDVPVKAYTIPLSVVRIVEKDKGIAGFRKIGYSYKNIRIHTAGRGILGFDEIIKEDTGFKTTEIACVTKWDKKLLIPTETKETQIVGGQVATTISAASVTKIGKNYFTYISSKDITDFDGNNTKIFTNYDISKGVITDETVKYDDDMYKKTIYSGYQNKSGTWLPTVVTFTQKHKDDSSPYITTTAYEYDDKGNPVSITTNSGTPLALKTVSTYDSYGNVLSTVSTGKGVKPITQIFKYDKSGRFVINSRQNPESTMYMYTYDVWGNVLSKKEYRDPLNASGNTLITNYTYDNWGRSKSISYEDSTRINYDYYLGGELYRNKYCIKESASNKPSVRTWYDYKGREVFQESVGIKGICITKSTTYNNRGQISKIENRYGKLVTSEEFTYDERGRVLTDAMNSGTTKSYSYSNRSTTTTIGERNYTITTDAWGNIISSTDPISKVNYTYSSNGKPSSVSTNGSTIYMEYDAAGNRTTLTDPDAGKSTYTHSADGKLLRQVNGKGIETINTYDDFGRLVNTQIGNTSIVNTYGTSGYGNLQLIKSSMGNNSVEYSYDRFGNIITEKRNIDGKGTFSFGYEYNDKNQLSKTSYPGGLDVIYQYDELGFKNQTIVGRDTIYRVESNDGLTFSTLFLGKMLYTRKYDERGFEASRSIDNKKNIYRSFRTTYDGVTGNLLERVVNGLKETFEYDAIDRLVSARRGSRYFMKIDYSPNGNIIYKSGIGNYYYNENERPHAVVSVDNTSRIIPTNDLITDFNDFDKIQTIEDTGKGNIQEFGYGPDMERWFSVLSNKGKVLRTIINVGNYEKITENGKTHELYYLDGNTIVYKRDSLIKPLFAFKDNLGSILTVVSEDGYCGFKAVYDVWGKQSITNNNLGIYRGYTGHEMLPEFNLINMDGRLYDPLLGQFLSPDNYIQMPDNSQSFNRYSYCLNNPLKYTDPTGEFWHFVIGAAIGGIINWLGNGAKFNAKGLGYFAVGAVAGAIGAGVSSGVSSALPIAGQTSGGFIAGFLGTSSATIATSSFTSGALIGGSAGIINGAISGAGNALIEGNKIGVPLARGAIWGGLSGALIGGIGSGIDAIIEGRRFFDGAISTKTPVAKAGITTVKQIGKNNCLPASGECINKALGGELTQDVLRKSAGGDPDINPIGIQDFWENIYETLSGHHVKGYYAIDTKELISTLIEGGEVSVNIAGKGIVYHAVVVKEIFYKTVQKINGEITSKLMLTIMDPAIGLFRNIPLSDVTGQMWLIYK